MVLIKENIRARIIADRLIEDYIDLETQLQPAGFDLTLRDVFVFKNEGKVDFDNSERRVANTSKLSPDSEGWYFLPRGAYTVLYNETTNMPDDLVALARTRSSLLRNGAEVETGVWDPGYVGKSTSLLIVSNQYGIKLKKNARIVQLVFFEHEKTEEYSGDYNLENLTWSDWGDGPIEVKIIDDHDHEVNEEEVEVLSTTYYEV